jgi:hypothetical protein
MKNAFSSALLCATLILTVLDVSAQSKDPGIAAIAKELDAVETKIAAVKKGDAAGANAIIKEINALGYRLNERDKSDPQWAVQAQRCKYLDSWVRAQALGQPKPSAGALDDYTKKAIAELDSVAPEIEKIDPLDVAAINAIVGRLNGSRDLLSKSTNRQQQAWKDAAARADALDKRVRERHAQAKASGSAASPASGAAASGAAAVKALPDDIAKGLDRDDKYLFENEFVSVYRDYANQVNKTDPRYWADEFNAGKVTDAVARMRKVLQRVKNQGNDGVQLAGRMVGDLESAFKAKRAEGQRQAVAQKAAAEAEAADVGGRLAEVRAFFDPATFSCKLDEPFTQEKTRAWVAMLREYQALRKKGVTMLEKIVAEHPNYAQDQRVKDLRFWFGTQMDQYMARDIGMTTEWYKDGASTTQGRMLFLAENAARYLEKGMITDARLLDEEWVAAAIKETEDGLGAAMSLVVYRKEYLGKDEPRYAKLATDLQGLSKLIQEKAVGALKNSRMPEAMSTDPKLLQVAKTVVARAGATGYERMVINYDVHSKSREGKDARVEGEYIVTRKWVEEWDEFQVALAEKVDPAALAAIQAGEKRPASGGGDYYIVFYTIKKFTRAPAELSYPTDWFCSDWHVSRRILKESIQK